MTNEHPVKRYLVGSGKTYKWAAERLASRGWKTSANYIKQICCGNRWPVWEKAKLISRHVCNGKVSAEQIVEFGR